MPTKQQIEKTEEQIYQQQKIVDFDTREFTIEYVTAKYLNGVDEDNNEIYVPDYQREFVWDEIRQSKLIESIILGLPIPLIFLAENKEKDNRLEIVDGSQRIRTLAAFIKSELTLINLEKLDLLNGLKFSDLNIGRQRKINNTPLRMVVLSDKATEEIRNEIFERINRGSELLQAMEKRKGIYKGAFSNFIYDICAKNELFIRLTQVDSRQSKRQEKEELVLRFFAISDNYEHIPERLGIAKFLDEYLEKKNIEFEYLKLQTAEELENSAKNDSNLNVYYARFISMLKVVEKCFPNGFSKNSIPQVSRVYFEAISVGAYLALKTKPDLQDTITPVNSWINSNEFKLTIAGKYQTHNRRRIHQRVDFVKDHLLSNG